MQKDYTGTVDLGSSWEFMNYSKGICKTLKATNDRISVIEIINLSERIDMKNDFGKIAKQAKQRRMPPRESEWGNWWKLCRSGVRQKLFVSYTYGYARRWKTTAYCGGTEIE